MNLFEKIFNYQVISRLDEAGSFALTSQERGWLKSMLAHPTAADAFTPETFTKLSRMLEPETEADLRPIIIEKAKSQERQVYHPLLRTLRRIIMSGSGIKLTSRIKHGGVKENQIGLPYKLEYSMVKREWYLLWYSTRQHSLLATKLPSIIKAEEIQVSEEQVIANKERIARLLEDRLQQAVVEVNPAYNAELSRILYAFSCFDKSVDYDEDSNVYRIRISHPADESEFLLSRIRFLGKRVRIMQGDGLKRRMRETASKALARYGVE